MTMVTWEIERIDRKRARERHGLFRRGADTTALGPAFVDRSKSLEGYTKACTKHGRIEFTLFQPFDSPTSAPRLAVHNGTNPLHVRKSYMDQRMGGVTVRTRTFLLWYGSCFDLSTALATRHMHTQFLLKRDALATA